MVLLFATKIKMELGRLPHLIQSILSNRFSITVRYRRWIGLKFVERECQSSLSFRSSFPGSGDLLILFLSGFVFRMNGRIDTYNSDTKVYTVKWDEDNVLEDFSDLNKVDQLVANAAEQVQITNTEEQVTETNDDEVDEQFDWDDNEKLGQAPSSNGSPYRGSVPEDFDFGYTYQYDNLADYEPWPIGTVTLLEFSDGWYEGKITSFSLSEDKTNATYVVTWSDGTGDRFVNELEWMDLMVANAQHYEPWSIGT